MLMAPVDDNKHRLKCLTYRGVCSLMGDHIQLMLLYDNTCVLYISVFKHPQSLLYLWTGFMMQLLTNIGGGVAESRQGLGLYVTPPPLLFYFQVT